MENSLTTESSISSNDVTKKEDNKFWGKVALGNFSKIRVNFLFLVETLFLGSIAAVGLLFGFSNGISLAKKNDETAFNKVFALLTPDKFNLYISKR